MSDQSRTTPLIAQLDQIAAVLEHLQPGPLKQVGPEIVIDRDAVVSIIRNHLIPRLQSPRAPLNIVFAGPTGSGKSTLINSVVGRPVSESGYLRPTTTLPLAYTRAENAEAFRLDGVIFDVVVGASPILHSISLIDTPDLDSMNQENRRRALDAISRADLVVFVSSALRYADLVPWEVLQEVANRSVPIIYVINRVSSDTAGVVTDFRRRLRRHRMSLQVERVEEHRAVGGDLLPPASIRRLRRAIISAAESERGEFPNRLDSALVYVKTKLEVIARGLSDGKKRQQASIADLNSTLVFPPAAEVTDLVDGWKRRISGIPKFGPTRRRRHELDAIGRNLREEFIGLVEQDIRLAEVADTEPIVDLTELGERPGLVKAIDSAFDTWFDSLVSVAPMDQLGYRVARRRLRVAIEAVRLVFDPGDRMIEAESGDAAMDLKRTFDELYDEVRSRFEAAITRSEADLVESLIHPLNHVLAESELANA